MSDIFSLKKNIYYDLTFALDSSMSTSKLDVSSGLLTSGMYGGVTENEKCCL